MSCRIEETSPRDCLTSSALYFDLGFTDCCLPLLRIFSLNYIFNFCCHFVPQNIIQVVTLGRGGEEDGGDRNTFC